jgi:hypothetical protein
MSTTEWVGTTTDGALGSNWSNGVPDEATIDALISGVSVLNILTGFGAIRARQTLAGTLQPADGDTILLDAKTYTFKTSLTDTDGFVAIGDGAGGGTVSQTHENLKAAVNLEAGSGTKYAASTTLHPTATGLSVTAIPSSIYAAKDAGTAGNSIVTTDVSTNWAWLAGTMSGGAASGATMGNIYVEPPYPGAIHTSGTRAAISCGIFFNRGVGQKNIDFVNCNRFVNDAPNYVVAADLIMTSSLVMLEVTSGRVLLHAPVGTALPDKIYVSDGFGQSENLRLTGDSSLTGTQIIVTAGIASIDGPDWTNVDVGAATLTIVDGAVATLRSSGFTILKSTDTMVEAFIMGGDFDLTQGAGGKTVTDVWLDPRASFDRRDDIDSFTLHEIGVR